MYAIRSYYDGTFNTVRAHLKYDITENTVIRASGGKGYRVANIFAENVGVCLYRGGTDATSSNSPSVLL